jgi:hypothetical protein
MQQMCAAGGLAVQLTMSLAPQLSGCWLPLGGGAWDDKPAAAQQNNSTSQLLCGLLLTFWCGVKQLATYSILTALHIGYAASSPPERDCTVLETGCVERAALPLR